jgi:hypothetical protein
MYIIHNYDCKSKHFFIIFYRNPFSSGKKRAILKLLSISLIPSDPADAKRFAHAPQDDRRKPRTALAVPGAG